MDQRHPDRRDALTLLGASASLAFVSPVQAKRRVRQPDASDTVLWYAQPATSWVEALPVGAGRIGAMVHGGIDHEYLQLNEDTFWSGGPYDPASPEALSAMPEARRLIFAERYEDAAALIGAKIMARPVRQMPYGTIGSLVISRQGAAVATPPEPAPKGTTSKVTPDQALLPVNGYRRELDLDNACVTTRWTDNGVEYRREVIASAADQVIATRMSAQTPGSISVTLSFVTPVAGAVVASGRDGELLLRGRNDARNDIPGALTFTARTLVQPRGGQMVRDGDKLVITGADELVVLTAMATSYKRFDDVTGDPDVITAEQIERVRAKSWRHILDAAAADHRALYRRVAIDLGRSPMSDMPTDRRVRRGKAGDDPSLAALYFNYARYLLISCSRPGSQPANLQGIWNDSPNPPWGGKYTININTEMNYWLAEPTNLSECVEPLVAMLRDLSITGARTAKTMYGARGWVCHHNTDLWRATAPIDAPNYGTWPTGGAWLCTHLWEHYDYNRDRAFLASVYPIMKGAALFFVDTLVKDPRSGFMVTNPTISPENRHGADSALCAGPTMDMAILRDLFSQTAEAGRILGEDAAFGRQLLDLREQLAPFRIGAQGQLQEWQSDWDANAPDIHHRHVSHLYAVYPSNQISVERTPELAAASKRSLNIRGDEATGWATAWRIALWARLRDGERAHDILRFLIGPRRTYPNMLDAHPPFQIDGNFGGAAAIAEMLMSSAEDRILLLPALPKAWRSGSISGLRARGACTVDLAWRDGVLERASVESRIAGRKTIRAGNVERVLDLRAGQQIHLKGPGLIAG